MEIEFIKDKQHPEFTEDAKPLLFKFQDAAVPRVGERIEVRHLSRDNGQFRDESLEGTVSKVAWYFSTSNSGPIATVYVV